MSVPLITPSALTHLFHMLLPIRHVPPPLARAMALTRPVEEVFRVRGAIFMHFLLAGFDFLDKEGRAVEQLTLEDVVSVEVGA